MINWYFILAASFGLLSFLFWKEWKRRNKSRLLIRLSASLIAVISLLLSAYPTHEKENSQSTGKVIVLTGGFIADSLKNFLQNKNAGTPVFSNDLSIVQTSRQNKVHYIPDLAAFSDTYVNDTIHVFGSGFTKKVLGLLHDHSFIFHGPPAFSSTSSVYWKQQLKTGEPLTVQGKYVNVTGNEIKILLEAFGEILDSVAISPQSQTDFAVTGIPKHTGKAVYSLIVLSGHDTLQNEPVPLSVQAAPPLKILILSSSPDFEKTFLKNRLSQNGYEITMSTSISKSKNELQFLNTPQSSANQINPSYLERFDVLIADDDALAQLNASGTSSIRSAIEEKGMGLIVKMNGEKNSSSFYANLFPAFQLKQDKKSFSLIHSSINDSDRYKLKIEDPVCLRHQNSTQVLLQDEQSNIYAANTIYGQGRIVATTLNNTYTLALSGENKSWQSLWSLLLDKAARRIIPDETWQSSPAFSYVNEPSAVVLESGSSPSAPCQIGESKIFLEQNSLLRYQWKGTYWPVESGWQSLIQLNGQVQNWYAYNKNNWKTLGDFQKLNATKEYTAAHPVLFIQQAAGQNEKWTSYIKFYLVILFFICCSVLWVEQKLA
jgi:hypothetical protein